MDIDLLFLAILLLPMMVPLVMKFIFHSTITWKEMGLHLVIVLISTSLMYLLGSYKPSGDYEIWNGQIKNKVRKRVSCRHDYCCAWTTVSCGKNCTTQQCVSTCYDHPYDVDWLIYSDLRTFDISTEDRQGLIEPRKWTEAHPGDPVSVKKPFENFIKIAPESLFNKNIYKEQFKELLPDYPKLYDYYEVKRVIQAGVEIPIANELDRALDNLLRTVGPLKKNNTIIVFVKTNNPKYRYALESHWLGGKKNDAIVVIGITDYPEIAWVDVFGWSKNDMFNVVLRDDIVDLKIVDMRLIEVINTNIVKYFEKRSMSEFEYLKDEYDPPMWALITVFILAMAISIALTIFFHRNEVV